MFAIKVYFYVYGDKHVTRYLGRCINITTTLNKIDYNCTCQEVIFKSTNHRTMIPSRIVRQYEVTMRQVEDVNLTVGNYPLLCSVFFRYTNYPFMLAIKTHHQLNY